jgi:hypothetical protein
MAKIAVRVRDDRGDLGTHPRYGALTPGATIMIEEADFGAGLFERPAPDWVSPHEEVDAARAAILKQPVGDQPPPAKPAARAAKNKEVIDHA